MNPFTNPGAVVLDVDLGAGRGLGALDVLAASPNEFADAIRWDFDGNDAWRVRAERHCISRPSKTEELAESSQRCQWCGFDREFFTLRVVMLLRVCGF